MGLFRKKSNRDDGSADPQERSPQLGLKFKDLAVMGSLIDAGADLTEPRHVLYFLYFAEPRSRDAGRSGGHRRRGTRPR